MISSGETFKYSIIWLLIAAAFFSFWQLGRHDVITDEASYMARGIAMLDFNFGILQPTPVQWVESVPSWMRLSFHDHPPLVFFTEYLSFGLFGEDAAAGRIPPAVAGLFAVFFVYLIGRELYGRRVGLISAAFFAFTAGHVWISRTALQESLVIALMLAASYAFLRALADKKILPAVGAVLGLALLAKYTAVILIPVFLTVLALKRRDYFFRKEFIFAAVALLVVVSPVIIYNAGLYMTFGHFDFQLSYVFGNVPEAWKDMPGKEAIGTLSDRVNNYLPALFKVNSPVFLLLSFAGLLLMLRRASEHAVFFAFLLWFAAFMFVVGPAERFLTMLVPWFAVAASFFTARAGKYAAFYAERAGAQHSNILKNVGMLFLLLIIFFEMFYSYNSAIAVSPVGGPGWAYAEGARRSNHNWGYNQLEEFISRELAGKRPEPAVSFEYPALAALLERAIQNDAESGLEPAPWMMVYNGNMALSPQLWTFLRRMVEHGWPVADAETYRGILAGSGPDYFGRLGIKKIYFINNADIVRPRRVLTRPLAEDGDVIENELLERGIAPREIKNLRGEVAFRVYEFVP